MVLLYSFLYTNQYTSALHCISRFRDNRRPCNAREDRHPDRSACRLTLDESNQWGQSTLMRSWWLRFRSRLSHASTQIRALYVPRFCPTKPNTTIGLRLEAQENKLELPLFSSASFSLYQRVGSPGFEGICSIASRAIGRCRWWSEKGARLDRASYENLRSRGTHTVCTISNYIIWEELFLFVIFSHFYLNFGTRLINSIKQNNIEWWETRSQETVNDHLFIWLREYLSIHRNIVELYLIKMNGRRKDYSSCSISSIHYLGSGAC